VVAAVDHPYDSAIVVRTDASTVSSTVTATGDDGEDRRRAEGWTAIRAADLRFVLSQLTAMDRGRLPENSARLAGRLDLRRVAVAGHSLGGAAAVQAAVLDDRFRSAIDIDGFPRFAEPGAHQPPVLALVAGRGTGSGDGDRRYTDAVVEVLSRSARPSFRLVVPRAGHLSFTDAALYLPPLPSLFGTGGRSATIEVTERASLAFLEATLNGGDIPALSQQLAELGEVTEFGR